jgi:hypothetical protein
MVEIIKNSGSSITTTTTTRTATTTTTIIEAPARQNDSFNLQIGLLFFGLNLIAALVCFILFKINGRFFVIVLKYGEKLFHFVLCAHRFTFVSINSRGLALFP